MLWMHLNYMRDSDVTMVRVTLDDNAYVVSNYISLKQPIGLLHCNLFAYQHINHYRLVREPTGYDLF